MNPYKNKCAMCNAPAANIVCSNSKCKSWQKYKIIQPPTEQGLAWNNPIIIYCPVCNYAAKPDGASTFPPSAICYGCDRTPFSYTYIVNRWYYDETQSHVVKYISNDRPWWDWTNIMLYERD